MTVTKEKIDTSGDFSEIGTVIRQTRVAAGYTLDDMVIRYGKSKSYWSKVETGSLIPTFEVIDSFTGMPDWNQSKGDKLRKLIDDAKHPLMKEITDLTSQIGSIYGKNLGNAFLKASRSFPGPSAQLMIRDFLSNVIKMGN